MPSLEESVAFAIWTAATGNASYDDWLIFSSRDKFMRMARAAIRVIAEELQT